ncbi:Cellular Amino Acid Transporter [Pleurotus pulmonarius]
MVDPSASYGATTIVPAQASDAQHGEHFDDVPHSKRKLGTTSVVFLIFNRIIGTGIYATPSTILLSARSPALALLMWLVGASIAAMGLAVYIEFGTTLPRSGGEKNYVEHIYLRPRFLATCIYAFYGVMANLSAANSLVFGEYAAHAFSLPSSLSLPFFPPLPTPLTLALLALSFNLSLHAFSVRLGLGLSNILGFGKLAFLCFIVIAGAVGMLATVSPCTGDVGTYIGGCWQNRYPRSTSLNSWHNFWEGSSEIGVNSFVTGLYNVIWSFIGYSNANYALSEISQPIRTIKRAAPLALLSVTLLYLAVNVVYLGVVEKGEMMGSGEIVAALFFRNLFGEATGKILSALIALSTLGNILAGQFTQGRIIQELGREGILPFSPFFASNKPFNTPLPGLFTQYAVSCAVLLMPPTSDAYLFLVNMSSYCNTLINAAVALGLVLLYYSPSISSFFTTSSASSASTPSSSTPLISPETHAPPFPWIAPLAKWNPPFRAPKVLLIGFLVSNILLIVVPLVPPAPRADGRRGGVYKSLPYWSHVIAALSISLVGASYWYVWSRWLPRRYGYRLERRVVYGDVVDGDAAVDERNLGDGADGSAQTSGASTAIKAKSKSKGVSRYVFRKVRVADGLS